MDTLYAWIQQVLTERLRQRYQPRLPGARGAPQPRRCVGPEEAVPGQHIRLVGADCQQGEAVAFGHDRPGTLWGAAPRRRAEGRSTG